MTKPKLSWVRFAPGYKATTIVSRHTAELHELPTVLDHQVLASKDDCSLIAFADYAPGAQRGEEGILSLNAIALDFDGLHVGDLEHIAAHIKSTGLAHWLHTSYSHRDAHKFIRKDKAQGPFDGLRVVLPLSRPVTPDEWRHVYASLLPRLLPSWWRERYGKFSARGLDPRSAVPAQGWYAPAHPPELADFAINDVVDGSYLDVGGMLAIPLPPKVTGGTLRPLTQSMLYEYAERQEHHATVYADEKAGHRAEFVRHVLAGTAPRESLGGILHETITSTVHSLQVTFGLLEPESCAELFEASNQANRDAGGDYRDFASLFVQDQSRALEHLAQKAEQHPERTHDRPEIEESVEESIVVDQACKALARDPDTYHRNGRLVSILTDASDPELGPQIRALSPAAIQTKLSLAAKWVKITNDKDGNEIKVRMHPFVYAVQGVAGRGHWPELRPLAGLTHAPTMREDGELLHEPGYDAPTGLYLTERVPLDIPAHPTRGDAAVAAGHLLALVQDFPFESEHDKAVWLALVLTRVARRACLGPSPIFCVTATTAGSGKTILAEAATLIATGRAQPMVSFPAEEDEVRKLLISEALQARECVFFDNVAEGGVGGSALDLALTSGRVSGRVLGKSETMEATFRPTWVTTGNNLSVKGDLRRRLRWIRLAPTVANPHLRTGFAIPNFRKHVTEYRPFYLSQALTILRAFHLAGRPKLSRSLGSFEAWSDLYASAVMFAGLVDPCTEVAEAEAEAQPDDRQTCFEVLCSKVLEIQATKPDGLYAHDLTTADVYPSIRYAVEAVVGRGLGMNGSATAVQVGYLLRSFRGKMIEVNGKLYKFGGKPDSHKIMRWKLK